MYAADCSDTIRPVYYKIEQTELVQGDKRMKEEIENVITFLEENEQYGDDWSKEIKVLKKILED